jgi:hypothetical protein
MRNFMGSLSGESPVLLAVTFIASAVAYAQTPSGKERHRLPLLSGPMWATQYKVKSFQFK